ncbi:Minor endoglucanase Y precursor [compost metagenome]
MLVTFACALPADAHADWERYRDRFVLPEGRVQDTGNGNITHSEGQSYGMLLAVHHGDRPTFERLWNWTRTHLRTRNDRLFAWKWTPAAGVADANNATDAELVLSWALLKAAERWSVEEWRREALGIGEDMLVTLYRKPSALAYLLPGAQGFEHPDGDVLNPSYWVFPAFAALHAATGRPEWQALYDSSIRLLDSTSFGRWNLPSDWLKLSARPTPAPGFAPRFGYDAIRVPLYLMWAGEEARLTPFKRYWASVAGRPIWPAWIDLQSNHMATTHAAPGMRAVARTALAYPNASDLRLPELDDTQDYYSASLLMLTRMMIEERKIP